jgi:hypothetical protein
MPPVRCATTLAQPPSIAVSATDVGIASGMLRMPTRNQRHPSHWPTILPLKNRVGPPSQMYDGSAQAQAMRAQLAARMAPRMMRQARGRQQRRPAPMLAGRRAGKVAQQRRPASWCWTPSTP